MIHVLERRGDTGLDPDFLADAILDRPTPPQMREWLAVELERVSGLPLSERVPALRALMSNENRKPATRKINSALRLMDIQTRSGVPVERHARRIDKDLRDAAEIILA